MADDTKPAEAPQLSMDAETAFRITIEQLQRENRTLRDELAAYKSLESERDAAQKASKAKGAARPHEARALVSLMGKGRRMIAPGEPITADEIEGLTLGTHYELAAI